MHERSPTDRITLDHLVVVAPDLASGEDWAASRLGCTAAGHGRHDRMGTHNALWGLGSAYLEVIAIDPGGPVPAGPRWFGLDDPAMARRLADGPFLATWAVSSPDPGGLAALTHVPHGPPVAFTRDDLTWEVSLPTGPALPLGGAWPLAISWLSGLHPAHRLGDQGLALRNLVISGKGVAPAQAALCGKGGFDAAAAHVVFAPDDGPTRLRAEIATPHGVVHLW